MLQNTQEIPNLSAQEAWDFLKENTNALLIDVRTTPEWIFIGQPDLATLNKKLISISWRHYPSMQINPNFADEITAQIEDKKTPLLFLCRSGGRSYDAAVCMKEAGYAECYNVETGFEGEPNAEGKRGVSEGWKAVSLPWVQQ